MVYLSSMSSGVRRAGLVSFVLAAAACGTSLVVGDDSGVASGPDAAATVFVPPSDGSAGDSARPESDAGLGDAEPDSADSGACTLVRSGNVISGCKVSTVSLQVNLSKVKDGGTLCADPLKSCCETSTEIVDASAPGTILFDLDTGALTWNGRVFEPLTRDPNSGDGGPIQYNVLPPTNTVETIDVGRSILMSADASRAGYDGFFPPWLAAHSGGGGGVAGETIQSVGTITRAEFDPVAGTLSLYSYRLPTLTTGNGCNPNAKIAVRADLGLVQGQDAGRD